MTDEFLGNGRRTIDLLGRYILIWAVVSLIYSLTRNETPLDINLSLTSVVIPEARSAVLLLGAMWIIPIISASLLYGLRNITDILAEQGNEQPLLTYPALANLNRKARIACGFTLSYIQGVFGLSVFKEILSPSASYLEIMACLAFSWFFAAPMIFFAWRLANWDKGLATHTP